MRYDAVVQLIAVTYTTDAIGQQVAHQTPRTVYANEFVVSHGEFYEAGAQGMKPERQYQLRSIDYNDEQRLIAGDDEFNIIRTERRGEWTRLTCERVVGNG